MMQHTDSDPDPLVGTILGERYRILRLLGEGGMGRVYEGRHTLIKRRVAIKVLKADVASDADFVERFLNEGRLAGTLGHPHIVESTDMGHADDGAPFLVYEYLEGESLATTIAREGGLAARRVATMGIQLASALRAAHGAGIVHRDVKPENIHRDSREGGDFCTILDFGISKRTGPASGQTRRGQILGTPEYMAPEQINDTDAVDARTDVYALGCVLYAMLAGRGAFDAASVSELFYRVTTTGPAPLSERAPRSPPGLVAIVERCMRRVPAERYSTMLEVERALRRFLEEYAGEAALRSVPPPPSDTGNGPAFRSAPTLPMVDNAPPSGGQASTTGRGVASPSGQDHARYVPAPTPMQTVAHNVQWAVVLTVCAGALAASGFFYARSRSVPPVVPLASSMPRAEPPEPVASARAVAGPTSALVVTCTSPGATVKFRGVSAAAPFAMDGITATDAAETVEVAAPGRQGRRFHVLLGRATSLAVTLPAGSGMVDATDSELGAALSAKPAAAPAKVQAAPFFGKIPVPNSGAAATAPVSATPSSPRPTLDTDALRP